MPTKQKWFATASLTLAATCVVCAVCGLLLGPGLVMPGATPKKNVTANILVFEDVNGDGRQNSSENPLPNTLIIAHSNIHGAFTRHARLTDAAGQATLTVTYTHYFDVGAIPPCGYIATTPDSVSGGGGWPWPTTRRFGFQPQPRQQLSAGNRLHFQLWEDVNGDGQRQADEAPLPGIRLSLDPRLAFTYRANYYDDDALTLVSDEAGQAGFELGTTCGMMWVSPPQGWRTTAMAPAAETDGDLLGIACGPGLTEILWGLQPAHPTRTPTPTARRFEFSNGGAYHPEGMGEWRLTLDSRGDFSGSHNLRGDITPYAPITLSAAENQTLWALIDAAGIPGLPPTFQRPGIPDETAYTFALAQDNSSHTVEMWAGDAEQIEELATLVRALEGLRDAYGFAPPPTATGAESENQ